MNRCYKSLFLILLAGESGCFCLKQEPKDDVSQTLIEAAKFLEQTPFR